MGILSGSCVLGQQGMRFLTFNGEQWSFSQTWTLPCSTTILPTLAVPSPSDISGNLGSSNDIHGIFHVEKGFSLFENLYRVLTLAPATWCV